MGIHICVVSEVPGIEISSKIQPFAVPAGSGRVAVTGDFPVGGGEMGALIRAHDWASTSLGPVSAWPQSLRTAVDIVLQSPIPLVMLWGPDGIMIYNDAYSAFAGGRHPRLLGSPVLEGWPEVADFNRRVMEVGLAGGTLSFTDQHLLLHRHGVPEDVWMTLDYSPIHDESGKPAGVLAIVMETTKRKRAEKALREREAELARVQQIGKVGGVEVDLAHGFRNRPRSPEYLLIHGLPPDAANETHDDWVRRLHPEDREKTERHFIDAVAGNVRDYAAEYRIIRPSDGELRWIAVKAEIERDADGRATRFVGAHIDITERKRAEERLQRLNETLESQVAERTRERDRVWNNSSELMAVAGFDGYLKSVNPAWTRLLGYDGKTLLARPFRELIHPDDMPAALRTIASLKAGKPLLRFEDRIRRADGGYSLISWTAVPEGDVFYAIGRDVSEQRSTEEALRQAQKMEAIGQLTGGIAHDFNNLLTGIIGSLDIVRRRIAAGRHGDVDRFIDAAVTSANRAAGLTHRLLAFSRRQSLDLKPIDVNRLVTSIEDLLRRTLGEQMEFQTDLHGELWTAEVDPNQLETALLNLAINARDAMPQGGRLTITTRNTRIEDSYARRHEELAPGEYIAIAVTDTGTGMTQEVIDRAFDPFFTTKPIGQGTGLGLSMVYGFAKQSRGHVRIRSEIGEGTTVTLYLARSRGDAVEEGAEDLAETAARALAGETVLVVEDDAAVRLLVTEVLGDLGYQALDAIDGKSALPILQSKQRIDLLVTDVGLPGLNGRQLAEIARQSRPGLKVLFITGYAEDAAIRGDFLAPGMEFMSKPFALDALAAKMREMLTG